MKANILLLFALAGSAQLCAADFCAVTVSIHTRDGIPLLPQVDVVDASGKVVQTLRARNGLAEICDLGFGEYSLDISPGSCTHTTLHGVRVYYGHTKHYEVISGDCPDEELMRTSCMFYFRVRDQTGKKLPGVAITGGQGIERTDSYGRAAVYVGVGKSETLQFAMPGREPQLFTAACKVPVEIDREILVPSK
jgi:hypothetical protein